MMEFSLVANPNIKPWSPAPTSFSSFSCLVSKELSTPNAISGDCLSSETNTATESASYPYLRSV